MTETHTPWLTKREAATYARVDPKTIERWVAAGKLKQYRISGMSSIRFRRDDMDALMTAIPAEADLVTALPIRGTPEYQAWRNMHQRCTNPKHPNYADYGGRGIDIDPRWADFAVFFADLGGRPPGKFSIDRIDNERGYWPGNVRWATSTEQSNNRRKRRPVQVSE